MAFRVSSKKSAAKEIQKKKLTEAIRRASISIKRTAIEKQIKKDLRMAHLELGQTKAEFERVRWLSSQFPASRVGEYIDSLEKVRRGGGKRAGEAEELFNAHKKEGVDIREIITFVNNTSRIDEKTLIEFGSPLTGYSATSKAQMLKNKVTRLQKKIKELEETDPFVLSVISQRK